MHNLNPYALEDFEETGAERIAEMQAITHHLMLFMPLREAIHCALILVNASTEEQAASYFYGDVVQFFIGEWTITRKDVEWWIEHKSGTTFRDVKLPTALEIIR